MQIAKIEPLQIRWNAPYKSRSAFVKVTADDGSFGLGEASPMQDGDASLSVIAKDLSPALVGQDALDHAVLLDRALHRCIKLGPEGILTAALAALDVALWDLKGKLLGQPIHKLLGGAWRTRLPCYSSIGGNANRTVDEMIELVQRRVKREQPSAVKIRFDGDRTRQDVDIAGDIAKAKAVRAELGADFMLGFDANNGYSVGGAMRVGRALEDLGFAWFEEPVQHYHTRAMGEVAQRLDITVSAGEQTYTLQGLRELIDAGVRMVQPDVTKMGGITGMMQCASLAHAHGVEFVPHQTQPSIGHAANLHVMASVMHLAKPVELADGWERADAIFDNPSKPDGGFFNLPSTPGLGLRFDPARLDSHATEVTI